MPSFEVELPHIVNGTVEEMTDEQRKQIAKLNAEIAADNVFRAMDTILKARDAIDEVARRYDPAVGDNAARRDCEAFNERLRDLMIFDAYKNYRIARAVKGLV